MSAAPSSSRPTPALMAAMDDVSPASMASAPPIMSNVLVSRDANVLAVKLPVSSIKAGMCLSRSF